MTWGSNSIPDVSAITSHFFSGGRDDPAKDPEVIAWLAEGDTHHRPGARKAALQEGAGADSAETSTGCRCSPTPSTTSIAKDLDFQTTSDEIPRFYAAKWN